MKRQRPVVPLLQQPADAVHLAATARVVLGDLRVDHLGGRGDTAAQYDRRVAPARRSARSAARDRRRSSPSTFCRQRLVQARHSSAAFASRAGNRDADAPSSAEEQPVAAEQQGDATAEQPMRAAAGDGEFTGQG